MLRMLRWKTLAKYLSNEADSKEKDKIKQWSNKNKDNLKSFEDLKMYWNQIEYSEKSEIDTEKAWNNLKTRIAEKEETYYAKDKPAIISFNKTLLRYAAVILILTGLGTGAFYTYRQINPSAQTVTVNTPPDIRNKKVILPDESVAYLNYNSKLSYPEQFTSNNRQVTVNGEVFFDVESDPTNPFIIKTRNAQIEALGTSFNVNTNLPDEKVEVLVQSGRVKVSRINRENQHITLEAGYKGILSKETLEREKNKDLNYLAWTTGRLIFKGQELEHVTKTLMRTYNVHINIQDPEIKDYRITTNFTNESIDTVLDVIAATFNLKINKIDENEYVIKDDAG